MSISDGLEPYIFRRKMVKTRSMKEEMDGSVFSRQSCQTSFVIIMINVLFPTLYFDLACKQFCFPPRKRYTLEKWKYKRTRFFISLWLSVDCTDCDWLFILKYHNLCYNRKLIIKQKNTSVFITALHFPIKNGNNEKQTKVGNRYNRNTKGTS